MTLKRGHDIKAGSKEEANNGGKTSSEAEEYEVQISNNSPNLQRSMSRPENDREFSNDDENINRMKDHKTIPEDNIKRKVGIYVMIHRF